MLDPGFIVSLAFNAFFFLLFLVGCIKYRRIFLEKCQGCMSEENGYKGMHDKESSEQSPANIRNVNDYSSTHCHGPTSEFSDEINHDSFNMETNGSRKEVGDNTEIKAVVSNQDDICVEPALFENSEDKGEDNLDDSIRRCNSPNDEGTIDGSDDANLVDVNDENGDSDKSSNVQEPITIQLFCKTDIPIIRKAADELKSQLNNQGLNIDFVSVGDYASTNPANPLFILCVNSSRLGTDASNAVKGLLYPKMAALLILHHQEKHALPDNKSKRVLVGEEFKQLRGIIDFAYTANSGMYSCDVNSRCLQELHTFVQNCVENCI